MSFYKELRVIRGDDDRVRLDLEWWYKGAVDPQPEIIAVRQKNSGEPFELTDAERADVLDVLADDLYEMWERRQFGLNDDQPPPTRKGACPKCGPSIVCTCVAS